ncbi:MULTISPECIES: glycosyltransferase family A protein [unclassified Microcoleus]|uniref:glycosyltransferase family A protein n=1 Tax=unclassified Microcoleus TaxID=2642155 RepID=UPI002FD40116
MNTSQNTLNQPLVSAIMPAFKADNFIAKTGHYFLSQTYQNIEVLVVDDCSTDTTAEIVQYFAKKDSRVSLFHQSNAGVAIAGNLVIEKSKGEYITPIDADDIWYTQNL